MPSYACGNNYHTYTQHERPSSVEVAALCLCSVTLWERKVVTQKLFDMLSFSAANPLPEDRLRYWNGYMLVYDSLDDRMTTPKTPKTPRVGVSSRSFRASTSRFVCKGAVRMI